MKPVVTIDFWSTLFDSQRGEERVRVRENIIRDHLLRIVGNVDEAKLGVSMKASWEYFRYVWLNQQRTPLTQELVEYFWQHIGVVPDERAIAEVSQGFADSILEHPPILLPGAKEALVELSNDVHIALISDTAFSPGRILRRVMQQADIEQHFSAFSFSDETGVAKPHRKAFETALTHFDMPSAQCLHIGDIEETDIKGAADMGMFSIRYDGDYKHSFHGERKPTQATHISAHWSEIPDLVRATLL